MRCPHIFIMRLVFFLSVPRKQLNVEGVENLQRQNDGKGTVQTWEGSAEGHARARTHNYDKDYRVGNCRLT